MHPEFRDVTPIDLCLCIASVEVEAPLSIFASTKSVSKTGFSTLQGHIKQSRQGVRSTKPTPTPETETPTAPPRTYDEVANPNTPTPSTPIKTKKLIVRIKSASKIYSDDMGRFPVRSCSGNYFIMLAYHVDCNLILVEPFHFQSRHDRHRLAAADRIMTRLQKKSHSVELQILDNECSAAYMQIEEK